MKRLICVIGFVLFLSNVSYAEKCFLYIEKPGNLNPQITSTLAISLISQYIEKLESIPLSGLGSYDCVYKVGVTESKESMFVAISGRGLSAYGDSKRANLDGLQQALLRAIYRAKLDKKEQICKAYGTILREDCLLSTSQNQSKAVPLVRNTLASIGKVQNKGFAFDLLKCFRSDHAVVCDFIITNTKSDKLLHIGYGTQPRTRIFDNSGHEYKFTRWLHEKRSLLKVANKSNNRSISHLMISGIPVNVQLSFWNFSAEATAIALLELELNTEKSDFFVKFRNIAIQDN